MHGVKIEYQLTLSQLSPTLLFLSDGLDIEELEDVDRVVCVLLLEPCSRSTRVLFTEVFEFIVVVESVVRRGGRVGWWGTNEESKALWSKFHVFVFMEVGLVFELESGSGSKSNLVHVVATCLRCLR